MATDLSRSPADEIVNIRTTNDRNIHIEPATQDTLDMEQSVYQ